MKKCLITLLSVSFLFTNISSVYASNENNFNLRCMEDTKIPKEWKEFQDNAKRTNNCMVPFRYVKKALTSKKPKSLLTDSNLFLNTSSCRLNIEGRWKFEEENNLHIHPNMVIQIVPFSTNDYPDTSNPQKDYGSWFNFMEKSLKDMTDYNSNYRFILPNKYFKINKSLKSYNVGSKFIELLGNDSKIATENFQKIAEDAIKVADSDIDFTNVDRVWFIGPRSSGLDVLSRYGAGTIIDTKEKSIPGLYVDNHPYDYKSRYWDYKGPFGNLHEMMHLTGTTHDHYGTGNSDRGTGNWGNMSGVSMDFLSWDKWLAKFITDSQVICIDTNVKNTVWIKPSTISGNYEKLLLIPISTKKAIAVESIRASGFNFKLPLCQQGALVYTIDITKQEKIRESGFNVVSPQKPNQRCVNATNIDNSILKNNNTAVVWGYKITVVESGEFGDVIRVSKV